MKEPITGLDEAKWWARTYLETLAATALEDPRPWTSLPPWRRYRRREPVIFPHPHAITRLDHARRWAALAHNVAAEAKSEATPSLLVLALLFSVMTTPLGVVLSIVIAGDVPLVRIVLAGSLALLLASAALAAMLFFLSAPVRQAPVWERRALALQARADEMAASSAALGEPARDGRWSWPRRR